jgi:hypothetical protein
MKKKHAAFNCSLSVHRRKILFGIFKKQMRLRQLSTVSAFVLSQLRYLNHDIYKPAMLLVTAKSWTGFIVSYIQD